jgi:hypothetical protein
MDFLNLRENPLGLKRAVVKFTGGRRAPQEILVGPGTTVADLLMGIGLSTTGFLLGKGTGDTVFGKDENLYPRIGEGDVIYCTANVDAGER